MKKLDSQFDKHRNLCIWLTLIQTVEEIGVVFVWNKDGSQLNPAKSSDSHTLV